MNESFENDGHVSTIHDTIGMLVPDAEETFRWETVSMPSVAPLPGMPGGPPLGETFLQAYRPQFNLEVAKAEFFMSSTFGKFALSGVMGGGLGLLFGAFMTTMSLGSVRTEDIPEGVPIRRQVQLMGRRTWASMKSSARNFALFGAMYAPTEQMVSVIRGKHDVKNSLVAGCATGAGMAVTGGPWAMAVGCAGCAALCGIMDHYFIHGRK